MFYGPVRSRTTEGRTQLLFFKYSRLSVCLWTSVNTAQIASKSILILFSLFQSVNEESLPPSLSIVVNEAKINMTS